MPLRNGITQPYRLASGGVNLADAFELLQEDEALLTQNCFYRRGIIKRLGMNKVSAAQVVTGKAIVGLHRFYFGTTSKQLVAAAGTTVKWDNAGTWTDIATGLTDGLRASMVTWGALDKMYYANGSSTDDPFSWDGTVKYALNTTITRSGTTTGTTADKLVDSGANFGNEASPTKVGMKVKNTTDVTFANITAIDSTTILSLDTDIMVSGENYEIRAAFNLTTEIKQFLPFRDRLLALTEDGLTWSKNYDDTDWQLAKQIRIPGPGANQFMAIHAFGTGSEDFQAKVLIFKGSSTWVMSGFNLDPTSAGFDVELDQVSGTVGCISPDTVVNTPVGTIFLGTDKNVYLLPYGAGQPIPIGDKIRSTQSATKGIEDIPDAGMARAIAEYHDGFYKLLVSRQGDGFNTIQWRLDLTALRKDAFGRFGPWYGPMKGQTISALVVQNGAGDNGQLIGGEGNLATGGFVYKMEQRALFGDDGTAIQVFYKSRHNDWQIADFDKWLKSLELDLLGLTGTVLVHFEDTNKSLSKSNSLSLLSTANKWGQVNWGAKNWQTDTGVARNVMRLHDKNIIGRRISVTLENSSVDKDFQIYSIQAEGQKRARVFAGALSP